MFIQKNRGWLYHCNYAFSWSDQNIENSPSQRERGLENVAARRVNITKLLFRWFSKAGGGGKQRLCSCFQLVILAE